MYVIREERFHYCHHIIESVSHIAWRSWTIIIILCFIDASILFITNAKQVRHKWHLHYKGTYQFNLSGRVRYDEPEA